MGVQAWPHSMRHVQRGHLHGQRDAAAMPPGKRRCTPAERRRARRHAAASAQGAIRRLTSQLADLGTAAAAIQDPAVRMRLLTSAPALAALCQGRTATGTMRLQRNVAMHSTMLPSLDAPPAAWRRAQRGPRLGRPDGRPVEPTVSRNAFEPPGLGRRTDGDFVGVGAARLVCVQVAWRRRVARRAAAISRVQRGWPALRLIGEVSLGTESISCGRRKDLSI